MTNDAPAQASAHMENPTAGETVGRSEVAAQQQSTVGTEDENRHVSRSDPSSQRSVGAEDEAVLDAAIEAYRAKACWAIVPANHRDALNAALRATRPSPSAVEALRNLEAACERLAALRSDSTYLCMIRDNGAEAALLNLDQARKDARSCIASEKGVSNDRD